MLLECKNISMSFGSVKALKNISFSIKKGEVFALCGENGSGKSTLMKILSGIYTGYTGNMLFDDTPYKPENIKDSESAGIVIIHQEIQGINELSVADNIFLGNEFKNKFGKIDAKKTKVMAKKALDLVHLSGVDPETKMKFLSTAEQQLVEIAKALVKEAKLIIFDEPTSSLGIKESEYLLEFISKLRNKGIAIIYISHRLNEIEQIADRIFVIRDGDYIGELDKADHNKIINMMVGRELNNLFPSIEKEIGKDVLKLRGLSMFCKYKHKYKIKNIDLDVKEGEIVGLAGIVGAGRTDLVEAIMGVSEFKVDGEIYLNEKKLKIHKPKDALANGIVFIPEERKKQALLGLQNILDNIAISSFAKYSKLGIVQKHSLEEIVRKGVKRFNIKTPSIFTTPISKLSGGNQQKAIIARATATNPKVLILDEPTRGVDVGAKFEIYKNILEFAKQGISVIFVSSELQEVIGIADRIVVMNHGTITKIMDNSKKNVSEADIMKYAVN